MKRVLIAVTVSLLSAGGSLASVAGLEHPPGLGLTGQLSTTLVRSDGGRFRVFGDVETRINSEGPTLGRLSIRCVSRCRAAFSDEIDGSPVSIIASPNLDQGDELITVVSEGATATLVDVYHVTPTAISSVLKTGTNWGWPSARTDAQGRPVIVVPESIDVGSGERVPKMEQVYRWNGKAFDLEFRPVTKP
jgi:hypothetical protein